MSVAVHFNHQQPVQAPGRGGSHKPVFVVVGYDGSDSSRTALARAAQLIHGRPGHLAVVFVQRPSALMTLAPQVFALARQNDVDMVRALDEEVREFLADTEPRWSFNCKQDSVVGALDAVAGGLRAKYGNNADIVIAVGGSMARRHRLVGSVGGRLTRLGRHPFMVTPAE